MEPSTTIILTFIGVLVIGAAKYYERKYGNNPEAWDNQKFGLFVIVAAIIMVLELSYTETVAFPADDIIDPLLQLMTPIFALFGAAYSTITGGKILKNAVAPDAPVAVVAEPVQTSHNSVWRPMSEDTKKWLTFDATPENKAAILAQIAEAEALKTWSYQIHFTGGFYNIDNGILIGSAGNPSGK